MLLILSIIVSGVLTGTVIFGCAGAGAQVSIDAQVQAESDERARVVILLPESRVEGVRSVDIETAQTHVNFYEAVFIKGDTALSATAGEGEGSIEINLVEGVYTILLAAGYKSSLATPLLLASGYLEGQTVGAGENVIRMTLKTIAVDITAADSVVQNETFEVRIDIDVKNPFITLAALPLCLNASSNKIGGVDLGINGNVHTWKYEVGAPATMGDLTVFIAHSFKVFGKSDWYIGYYNASASNNNFKEVRDFYKKTISVIANGGLPKVSLVVEWGS
jgi:hypothetical protein